MLSNLIVRYRLITDQLIRYSRLFFCPPTFALADIPSTPSPSSSPQSWLPDMSILLTQKHRATVERRRVRRHSDLPMSLMIKLGTPRQDLHQCLECGTWHEKKTICGNCYDRIRKETQAMKDAFPSKDEFNYNHPQQEISYVYKNDQTSDDNTKRIIEMPRERPTWFSKNLIPKINTTK
jgi:large subunit ribosomal protein L32